MPRRRRWPRRAAVKDDESRRGRSPADEEVRRQHERAPDWPIRSRRRRADGSTQARQLERATVVQDGQARPGSVTAWMALHDQGAQFADARALNEEPVDTRVRRWPAESRQMRVFTSLMRDRSASWRCRWSDAVVHVVDERVFNSRRCGSFAISRCGSFSASHVADRSDRAGERVKPASISIRVASPMPVPGVRLAG